jgi:hypothetical protein
MIKIKGVKSYTINDISVREIHKISIFGKVIEFMFPRRYQSTVVEDSDWCIRVDEKLEAGKRYKVSYNVEPDKLDFIKD